MAKIGSALFGIGITIIFIYGMWFIILYGIADPEAFQKLSVTEGIQNRTKDVDIAYNFEFDEPLTIVSDSETHREAIIDVSGITTGVIVGIIVLIVGKTLNRFWPDKK